MSFIFQTTAVGPGNSLYNGLDNGIGNAKHHVTDAVDCSYGVRLINKDGIGFDGHDIYLTGSGNF